MRTTIPVGTMLAAFCLCGCGEAPPAPANAPPPAPAAPALAPAPSSDVSAAPAASAAPAVSEVPRKECPKTTALAAGDEPLWHLIVQPGSCWALAPASGAATNDIVVESYDARMVGDADVARLRITHNGPSGPESIGDREHWPQQLAVSKKGVWFLDRKADSEAIGKALSKPPTYGEPARLVEPTKANKWQWVRKAKTAKGEVLCYGHDTPRGEGCEDHCSGMICISSSAGIVVAEGTATPTFGSFAQPGWRIEPAADPKAAAKEPTDPKKSEPPKKK